MKMILFCNRFDKENEIVLVKIRESCNFSLEIFQNDGKLIAKSEIEDAFYDTQISTGDIDRDGIAEIMLSVDCGGTAATNNYYIYKIDGKGLKKLDIPDDIAEVSIEENKVNVYVKKIDTTLEIILKKEDMEEIEMIESQAAEDNQDVTQGEANEYMFQKEDGEIKLIEEKRFGYGSNHVNSCSLGRVYLKYSYNLYLISSNFWYLFSNCLSKVFLFLVSPPAHFACKSLYNSCKV